ncbi:MAG: hypothetical protein J2P14_17010 [Acidothermales bacterium]|nr:hypothetical protein [Acidothermales bacterium]
MGDRIKTIAQQLDPDVDVVVSGHSHHRRHARRRQAGRAGVVVHARVRRGAAAARPRHRRRGRVVGAGRAHLDTTSPASTDPTAPKVAPDPGVQQVVDAAADQTAPIVNQVINHASSDIPSRRGRVADG